MYRPSAFTVDDDAWARAFMRQYTFGLFEMTGQITPMAFALDEAGAVLFGHVARANPQAEIIAGGGVGRAIFTGPHGYVSPMLYKKPAVPTWNYTMVEMTGQVQPIEGAALTNWLAQLVAREEAANGTHWTLDALPEGQLEKLQTAIQGFELRIEKVEGKAKLSQNKGASDRTSVENHFRDTGQTALADLMKEFGG